MFYFLYYCVTINESKEKLRIVFCYFSAIKNIVSHPQTHTYEFDKKKKKKNQQLKNIIDQF